MGDRKKTANDSWSVAKTGLSDSALPLKVGGKSIPTAVDELDKSKNRFDIAYRALLAADKKFASAPDSIAGAQEYLVAYSNYIQAIYDLQSRVQHFNQTGWKGLVSGINFALDAATLPLLMVGAGEAAVGLKFAFQQGFKSAGSLMLKSMPKAAAFSAGYAVDMTAGDFL